MKGNFVQVFIDYIGKITKMTECLKLSDLLLEVFKFIRYAN